MAKEIYTLVTRSYGNVFFEVVIHVVESFFPRGRMDVRYHLKSKLREGAKREKIILAKDSSLRLQSRNDDDDGWVTAKVWSGDKNRELKNSLIKTGVVSVNHDLYGAAPLKVLLDITLKSERNWGDDEYRIREILMLPSMAFGPAIIFMQSDLTLSKWTSSRPYVKTSSGWKKATTYYKTAKGWVPIDYYGVSPRQKNYRMD